MSYETIEVTLDGARGDLRLNRPDKLNALSGQVLGELIEAARWFDQQPQIKVVVVSGNGRAFSAGADVSGFGSQPDEGWTLHDRSDMGRQMAAALDAMRAITIARIHGHCIGGALVLASACDMRIAAAGTNFSIPEVDLGIPLAWGGIPRLVREIGPAMTRELVLTCRPFSAEEALQLGFLNKVVPADELDSVVDDLAAQLAGKSSLTLVATKRHINAVLDEMAGTGRAWADADALIAARADPESQQAAEQYMARFRKK